MEDRIPKTHPDEEFDASGPIWKSSFQIWWSGFLAWMKSARSFEKVIRRSLPSRTNPKSVSLLQEHRRGLEA